MQIDVPFNWQLLSKGCTFKETQHNSENRHVMGLCVLEEVKHLMALCGILRLLLRMAYLLKGWWVAVTKSDFAQLGKSFK